MMIRGEDSFLVGYVLLDKREGFAEGSVVENVQLFLQNKINTGELQVPPGVCYKFESIFFENVHGLTSPALSVTQINLF